MLIIVDALIEKLLARVPGIFVFNNALLIVELKNVIPTTQEKLMIAPISNTNKGSNKKHIIPAKPIAESESYLRITIGAINTTIDIIAALTIDDEKSHKYM